MQIRTALIFFIILLSLYSYGQKLTVHGQILDSNNLIVLPYAHVYTQSHKGTYADIDGVFHLQILSGDTLTISSLGYNSATLVMDSTQLDARLTIVLKKTSIVLNEVRVQEYYQANTIIKNPARQKMNIPGVSQTQRQTNADDYHLGVAGSIFSPAEAIYRATSKKYKEQKRNYEETVVRKKEYTEYDEAKDLLDEVLELIGESLDEYHYRDFISHMGMNPGRLAQMSEYDLVQMIPNALTRYRTYLNKKALSVD
ncbi:MAG: carboxypeptidase-like regulatory domain-containing protein [Reichenbachiella sp.]